MERVESDGGSVTVVSGYHSVSGTFFTAVGYEFNDNTNEIKKHSAISDERGTVMATSLKSIEI